MSSGARKLHTSFTAGGLTHFGGIYLVHAFLRQIHLRSYLQQHLQFAQRNNYYTLSEILIAFMYPMILGLEKIEVSALLKTNGVFHYITGLPSFPDPTTLRRFLVRSADTLLPHVRAAHNQLRTHFLTLPVTPTSFWIDCDSTVKTLYGHQEGVVKGYNPHHRGKKSYHPLIITEAHRGDCLGGVLRHGNVHTADGVQELLSDALTVLPHHHRLRLRADSGFYEGTFIDMLNAHDIEYAVVARMTKPVTEIVTAKRYRRVTKRFSVGSFRYQPHDWKRAEHFVVLRRDIDSDESEEQPTLFTVERYAYHVLVTNMPLTTYRIFAFYQDRSAMERIIRVLKDDYPLGTAPTKLFQPNALYAELSLLTYNLMQWFKQLCLPDEWQSYTLPTIRHKLLMIPGEFVRTGNKPTLKFPRNTPYKDVIRQTLKRIKKLKPLI